MFPSLSHRSANDASDWHHNPNIFKAINDYSVDLSKHRDNKEELWHDYTFIIILLFKLKKLL